MFDFADKIASGATGGQYGGTQVTYTSQGPEAMQVPDSAVAVTKSILAALVMIGGGLVKMKFWMENGGFILNWSHFSHLHHGLRKKYFRSLAPPTGPQMQWRQLLRL